MAKQINTLLVANRGEIAVRVFATARAMGIKTIAVFSEADAGAPHVQAADNAVCIGPPPAPESYLAIDNVIAAAKSAGADAVHPGYGFLAENADFAEACADAGLTFVGPPADAVRLMGNKRLAKIKMAEADVPCVPGYSGEDQSDDALTKEAGGIGYPLMVKAAAGGGGRGMRRVDDAADLAAALASARSESLAAFGSDELILEKAIDRPRHVEIQVFADGQGNTVHLGERDCSVQRRHQKVIEEAPSPAVDADLRARMGEAAVKAAQAIGYVGAGTVEFLLGDDGAFYFMEMNTRLQVEHPVTEMITGLDLVEWQLRVARGEDLPLDQDDVKFDGHAIEVRLYAEDPAADFMPQTGRVLNWSPPEGNGVRTDHGVADGMEVTPFYDPMIAKIAAFGPSREDARRKLIQALADCTLLGVGTNQVFLARCLGHQTFADGGATTAFIEDCGDDLMAGTDQAAVTCLAAALLATRDAGAEAPWFSTGVCEWPLRIEFGSADAVEVDVTMRSDDYTVAREGSEPAMIRILERSIDAVRYEFAGVEGSAVWMRDGNAVHVSAGGITVSAAEAAPEGSAGAAGGDGRLIAPMPGRVVRVNAAAGASVAADDILVVIEAMKMEHEIGAGVDGTVTDVAVAEGDQVSPRQLLMLVEPDAVAE